MTYQSRTFSFPSLTGLSAKQLEVHVKLYEAYVRHANLILSQIEKLSTEPTDENIFMVNELRRRFGFEFDGMRMHEYYFEQLEGGAIAADEAGSFANVVAAHYGSWDAFITHVKAVCGTRGIGWTVIYYDATVAAPVAAWVNDHELGQLSGLPILLAIDMWEHAYMVDYVPAEKKTYVEAFLENLNWNVVEGRFANAAI